MREEDLWQDVEAIQLLVSAIESWSFEKWRSEPKLDMRLNDVLGQQGVGDFGKDFDKDQSGFGGKATGCQSDRILRKFLSKCYYCYSTTKLSSKN